VANRASDLVSSCKLALCVTRLSCLVSTWVFCYVEPCAPVIVDPSPSLPD